MNENMKKDIVLCQAHKIKNTRSPEKITKNAFSTNNRTWQYRHANSFGRGFYCFKMNKMSKSFQLRILFFSSSFFQFRQIGNFFQRQIACLHLTCLHLTWLKFKKSNCCWIILWLLIDWSFSSFLMFSSFWCSNF